MISFSQNSFGFFTRPLVLLLVMLSTLLLFIVDMNINAVNAFQMPSTIKHCSVFQARGTFRCSSLSLSSSTNAGEMKLSTSNISITQERLAILDGSSYKSLLAFLSIEQQDQLRETVPGPGYTTSNTKPVGVFKIIVGTRNQERIVAMAKSDSNNSSQDIWEDSIAKIPTSVSDDDAMSTLLAALTGIHCSLQDPKRLEDDLVQYVGGSNDTFEVNENESNGDDMAKKVVVLGGSEYASFLSE